ncbi:hypothetical protein HPB51_016888 [Rhipicephalus microplus]|uniref:Uncharacterized protein n=1 Tax=Rhipicephalus microplus TaxID=6941 RepID=A0A9J6E2R8_RHIMP|nr:ergosterol biosynthetic protein 28 homolog [Rhipicephalus microplus]KAH8028437.1 hypothetical protein HPB51_016888 [Rhipicephalus microplus]
MTTHWIVHPLRSWLGLMSITNLGAGVRCLLEEDFLRQRLFTKLKCGEIERCPEMERTFAFWSLYNGVLVLHCSIFLEQPAVYSATLCCLAVYLVYFGNEMFIHGSICMAGKAVLFPVLLSATLVWMLVARQYIWVRRRHDATDTEENEQLEERLSLQNMRRLRKSPAGLHHILTDRLRFRPGAAGCRRLPPEGAPQHSLFR